MKSAQLVPEKDGVFNLDQVKGDIKLNKSVTLQPYETTDVSGILRVREH